MWQTHQAEVLSVLHLLSPGKAETEAALPRDPGCSQAGAEKMSEEIKALCPFCGFTNYVYLQRSYLPKTKVKLVNVKCRGCGKELLVEPKK